MMCNRRPKKLRFRKYIMRRFVKLFGSYRIVVSIIGESDNAEEQKAIQKFVEQLISQGFVEEPGAIDEGEAE
ncbi:hypothetical protein B9Q05_00150 [Candidatus Marsarchaeota G2 archaeon ECH_B_1]|uniref:Uncharacterized protein n=3 Tax=Candidatus Marsarchaeota group 2 TaxID=2203771 RepID=A0A2R6BXE4_9ARCH|nr:MAG: hypothetical protein B9Q05_00150 [Candidatus Marsarchaeota G2 archaeon ECH_B_1]